MSVNSHEEVISQLTKAQIELKARLEQVSKMRIDCVKMQLELLKLYNPQCLEILKMLREVSAPPPEPCNLNGVGSRGNEDSEVRANEDVPRESTT
ncbi:PREDICTED: uncharacterized protein LOC106742850 [Dinoponera quadriceps]|uniref:Uncharacterized protein LOC106742850 n=1 Tax=Dinoponera quadriceps TaxID=609295 RepID=A0A6P3WZX5_DINQU|nr:PREDICTED: uncharacterized protein LOC106742850 [Dinoponera quadriceps]